MKFYQLSSLIRQRSCSKQRKIFVFSGRKVTQSATALEFSFDQSMYADYSRENQQKNLQLIFSVFKHFGLVCHVGRNGSKTKTEAI
jgi:hypothetical protein